jgi:hypothetical protein
VQVAAASETESRNTSKTLAWGVKIHFDPPRKGAYYSQAPDERYDSHGSEAPSTRSKLNVTSLPNAVDSQYATLESPDGTRLT